MSRLTVGFGQRDITPERNRQTLHNALVSDPHPTRDENVPIRDRLHARATAVGKGEHVAVWVTLDLLCATGDLRNRIFRHLSADGLSPDNIVVSASHTHTAPTVVHFRGHYPTPEDYLDLAAAETAEAIRMACRSRKPAEIAFGKATLDASVNRRQIGRMRVVNDLNSPTGRVDSEVVVARITFADSSDTGLLFNYAAHPLTMSAKAPLISADYPGRAVAILEAQGARFAQFLPGCAGNVNVKIWGDEVEADSVGRLLASAVLDAARSATPSASSDLRMISRTIRLPLGPIPTRQEAGEMLDRLRHENACKPSHVLAMRVSWAEELCRAIDMGTVSDGVDVLLQVLKVGNAVFLTLPGEVFAEIGLAIKERAGIEHLFVAAYSNSCEIGYLPTASAFREGGYEVEEAPMYYGLLLPPSPRCEQMLIEEALRMIGEMIRQDGLSDSTKKGRT